MRISVRSHGSKNIRLRFPTRMIFNSLTGTIGAGIANKYIDMDNGFKLKARDLRRFMREINRVKKKHPDLNIVEVQSTDGEGVTIIL
jgi:hypothetical protein